MSQIQFFLVVSCCFFSSNLKKSFKQEKKNYTFSLAAQTNNKEIDFFYEASKRKERKETKSKMKAFMGDDNKRTNIYIKL